jgi:GDP-mannose transporter
MALPEAPPAGTVGKVNSEDELEAAGVTPRFEDDAGMIPKDPASPELEAESAPSPPKPSTSTIAFGVALYAACSSTLLVINKVAMHYLPDAAFVLFCQFVSSAVAVRALKCARPSADIEVLSWEKTKKFVWATLVFYACLLSNTQALQYVNVETVIVARSCSPIAVALLDHVALGRDLPNLRGALALLSIAGGAVIYVVTDTGFQIEGYTWIAAYFVFIVVEMVFVKFIVDTVPMSTWTRVYYNNALSIPMAILSSVVAGGSVVFAAGTLTFTAMCAVGVSCVVGVAISYAGFNLRSLVSATTFTVVGVVCKIITVMLNDMIWKNHSNAMGHLGLLVCIVGGFAYERAKAKR